MSVAYSFRLYVSGDAPNSIKARSNLAAIIKEYLDGNCTIEEVDTLKFPRRAMEEHVMITPTLLRVRPLPERRIVGNLSEREAVVEALGLATRV
jgi:circadian clock protein KaiB